MFDLTKTNSWQPFFTKSYPRPGLLSNQVETSWGHCKSSLQLSVEVILDCYGFSLLLAFDWSRKLAPLSQPIKRKISNNSSWRGHSCFPVLQVMRFFIPQLSWQYWDIFPFFVICSCDYSDFGLTSLIKKHSYCNLRYLYKLWETRGRSEYQWNPTDTVYSFVREVEGKNNVSSFSSPKLQLITKECIKGVSF